MNDQTVNFGLERLSFIYFFICYIFRRKFENDYNLQINVMCSSLMFSFVLNVLAMIDVIDVTSHDHLLGQRIGFLISVSPFHIESKQ